MDVKVKGEKVGEGGVNIADENALEIIEGVRDNNGRPWVHIRQGSISTWRPVDAFATNASETFAELTNLGIIAVGGAAQRDFKERLQQCKFDGTGLVAPTSGWINGHFILGSGERISPPGEQSEVLIGFPVSSKDCSRGNLTEWQKEVGPFVKDQALCLFSIGLGFAPPLLQLLQSTSDRVESFGVEYCGDPSIGKTTLAVLAGSVWGGSSTIFGYCEDWLTTANAIEATILPRNDGVLILDEAGLAGETPKARAALQSAVIMRIAQGVGRARLSNKQRQPPIRTLLLSTSNESLLNSLSGAPSIKEAVSTRMATILLKDRPYGIFDSIPSGYESAEQAARDLRTACLNFYGAPIRAFVRRLVSERARNEAAVVAKIRRHMEWYYKKFPTVLRRQSSLFAVDYAAIQLAKAWGIIPQDWGKIGAAVRSAQRLSSAGPKPTTVKPVSQVSALKANVRKYRKEFVDLRNGFTPMNDAAVARCAGFISVATRGPQLGKLMVLVPKDSRHPFAEWLVPQMTALRNEGQAACEKGKLQIKRKIRSNKGDERVYAVHIEASWLKPPKVGTP